MKAEPMKKRPEFKLCTANDNVNHNYLQLPRWLLDNEKYTVLSIEAKFTYALLLNRFQLSKHNEWINEHNEVFVVYTRRELAKQLNVSEKKASAAMNELNKFNLIWERRCGRGFANQIYLAYVEIGEDNYYDNSTLANDDIECKTEEASLCGKAACAKNENSGFIFLPEFSMDSNMEVQELPNRLFMSRQNDMFRTVIDGVQEPPKTPHSNKDFINNYLSIIYPSQSSQSMQIQSQTEINDNDMIDRIKNIAELHCFSEDVAIVMGDAIERLYFMESIKIGNAVYPNERIKTNLLRLNYLVIDEALNKIKKNTTQNIRNSSAYIVTVLFNTIMEFNSDLLVDPYLNFLKSNTSLVGGVT